MSFKIQNCNRPELIDAFSDSTAEHDLIRHRFPFNREHWIVMQDGQCVGRVGAALSISDPKRGYIGFFKNDLQKEDRILLSKQLLETAEQWLKQMGAKQVYGPIHYSTWFNYRFQSKIECFNNARDQQFDWEPKYDPRSIHEWIDHGYQEVEKYHSKAHAGIKPVLKLTESNYNRLISEGYSTQTINLKQDPIHTLKTLEKINRHSFTDQFLIEPLDPVAYESLYAKPFSDKLSELSFFIKDPKGEEIGYSFSFIDHDYLVWKTMAIEKNHQGKSLATLAIHQTIRLATERGITNMVAALMKTGAQSELLLNRISKPLWTHEYILLRKDL